MSSDPAAPAAAGALPAGPEPTGSQLLKMIIGSLTRLVHPSIAPGILRAAAAEAGINLASYQIKEASTPRKKKEKGAAKARATQPYTHIFVKKIMDRMKEDPAYATQNLPLGLNGKPIRALTLAGILWKQLGDEKREAFVKTYQPLCDTVTSEQGASGLKTGAEDMLAKVHAFEATFDSATKALLQGLLPASLSHLSSGAVPALPVGALHGEDDDSESEDESEDSDDEAEAKAAAEAKRIEEEKKAKEAEEARKKKEEKEAKKAEKHKLASLKAPAAAPSAAQEDKKDKKKRKSQKEHGDQPGNSKKPSKDKV